MHIASDNQHHRHVTTVHNCYLAEPSFSWCKDELGSTDLRYDRHWCNAV